MAKKNPDDPKLVKMRRNIELEIAKKQAYIHRPL